MGTRNIGGVGSDIHVGGHHKIDTLQYKNETILEQSGDYEKYL